MVIGISGGGKWYNLIYVCIGKTKAKERGFGIESDLGRKQGQKCGIDFGIIVIIRPLNDIIN